MRRPSGARPGWTLTVLPAVVYLVAAFYMGTLDSDPLCGVQFSMRDKLMHALVFGGMQWTHVRAWRFFLPSSSSARVAWLAAGTATLAGALLEAWQFLLPHRTAEWGDLAADALGAAVAALLYVWLAPTQSATARPSEA